MPSTIRAYPCPVAALIGVDIGGTFTDVAVVDGGRLTTAKVSTTPDDQARGLVEGVEAALGAAGLTAAEVAHVGHGTTTATNALLERRGARTAFVATRGFGDLLHLARQTRPQLYRQCAARPAPLPEVTAEVDERMGPDGVVTPLDPASVRRAARRLRSARAEAVAICLLHSYADPSHETAVAGMLREELPGAFVVASHEVAPEYREYERASTAAADAYLGPVVGGYLGRLAEALAARGLPEPELMQSSGGLTSAAEAASHPARLLLSGPAGGVAAVVAGGARDAIAFDMGGTSCDVSLIRDGTAGRSSEREVGGLPVRLPMLDIHTVGAGGGSIAWIDPGGALRVGPHSAGADPAPACYGRGGTVPTVTDANLVLGRLAARVPLAGGLRLDRRAAERAVATIAGRFRSLRAAAAGIVAVANGEMVRAIRVVSVEQGYDPRRFELVAFGGAGPMHACEVADELGIRRIRVPAAGGVLSALGIAAGERRRDAVPGVVRPLSRLSAAELRGRVPRLPGRRGERHEAAADLRYRGQGFELTIPLEPLRTLPARFHERHQERFGFADPDAEIEVINLRAATVGPGAALEPTRVGPARTVRGPARVDLGGATLWVAEDWTARMAPDGGWSLRR
jgi:N-methylhydantoinase A